MQSKAARSVDIALVVRMACPTHCYTNEPSDRKNIVSCISAVISDNGSGKTTSYHPL
jgi:hypothetical protein